ncbi:MAG: hypothetical protein WCJ64_21925 [Rhodospirillaceae bacterium]
MLTLTTLMIVAIILSAMGKKGDKLEYDADEIDFAGHKPDKKDIRRAEERLRHRKKIATAATVALLAVAMLIDWSSGGNPVAGIGATGHGHARSPGLVTFPGWQSGSVDIPPQGFSGRMLVRFESGEASGSGFLIVAPGEKRRFGWRVVGGDAPSCVLHIDFKGAESREAASIGGFSTLRQEFGEGEHEASFRAWCPHGRNNVDFEFATMTTSRSDMPSALPSWRPANGADVRHR